MQTREPRKRVNWIFVIILLIVIPLVVFGIFMMETVDDQAIKEDNKQKKIEEIEMDSLTNNNSDTTLINNNN